MIIVKLIGGLGNQMFQYAAGKSLAIKKKTDLKLDIEGFKTYKLHNYMLDKLNIKAEINRLTLRSCRREQLKRVAGGYPPAREAH